MLTKLLILGGVLVLVIALMAGDPPPTNASIPNLPVSQGFLSDLSSTDPCRTRGLGNGVVADALTRFSSLDPKCSLFGDGQ